MDNATPLPEKLQPVDTKADNNEKTTKKLTGFQLNPEGINKAGRPKRDWTWAGLLEEIAEEEAPTATGSKIKWKKAVAKKLYHAAALGNIHAIRALMDRMDGLPKQKTELSGPDGGAIPILGGITKENDNE